MGSRGPLPQKRIRSARTATGVRLKPLPDSADAIFVRLAHDVDGATPADVAILELMAYWMEIAKDARRQMAEEPTEQVSPELEIGLRLTVTDTAHGNKEESRKNPLLIVLRTATEQIRALAVQLGASPMARARLPELEAGDQLSFGEQFFRAAADALRTQQDQ